MRKLIAALQMSVDGFIEDPNGELDWVKDVHIVGGATLVSSLMNAGLIDEIGLLINPLVLGGGKALFKDVNERNRLKLLAAQPLKSGMVKLSYSTQH